MQKRTRVVIICGIFLVVSAVALKTLLDSVYRLPVLMYHSIDYTTDKKNRMIVSPEVFARQMEFLHNNGYNVIPLEKCVSYLADRKKPPSKTVAITLDDGYKNNYTNVYPVVKKYNIPVTIFVITGLVERPGYLDWKEIREMSDSGVVDIESHTKSHKWLTGLDDKALKDELEDSKNTLEERLGKKIDYICYPMGGYDKRVKAAARNAGYRAGFATKPKRLKNLYDIFEIKRVRISPTSDNMFVFYIKLTGYHAFFRVLMNDHMDIPSLLTEEKR